MSDAILVSVIVPVYQGKTFLAQCLESLCQQTLKSIEFIIVNDGSTDGSLDIIKAFAEKDIRIRYIHQENKGVSAARNTGLELATGEYVGFVDADDWVDPAMYQMMYEMAIRNDADMIISNVLIHESTAEGVRRLSLADEKIDVSVKRNAFISDMMDFKFDYANWNKLYRRSLIQSQQISFSTSLRIWEDLLFNLEFATAMKTAFVTDQSYYHYRLHEASVMHQQREGRVLQYQQLFHLFTQYCNDRGFLDTAQSFGSKIASGFYHVLIPDLANQANMSARSASQFVAIMTEQLNQIDVVVFQGLSKSGTWLQRYKKRQLRNGRYRRFSMLLAFKHYYKK